MKKNSAIIGEGLAIMVEMLAPYVAQQLQGHYRKTWWQEGVLDKLKSEAFNLPAEGDFTKLVNSMDAALCLKIIKNNWREVFVTKLSRDHRNWVEELIITRNNWAHMTPISDFADDDAWRALDTMARLMEQIDNEATVKLRKMAKEIRDKEIIALQKRNKNSSVEELIPPPITIDIKPWTQVIQPHPDVAQGRYRQAEFAADLFQVYKGHAEIEYQDPVEFFNRTYVTDGMQALLTQALKRITIDGGEPVIQLKTAFGGGKTHSMLALYHLLRSGNQMQNNPSIKSIIEHAGIKTLPSVRVAVIVGTALNPSTYSQPPYLPGIRINTLWGEIAAQLAHDAGKPEAYNLIKEADQKSVAPGSEALTKLFDTCGPCLILIDELVAYARKIYNVDDLPAGSFDNLLTFIQELTEAVRASKNSVLVASIPESDREVGGKAGLEAQEYIERVFGRMESVWKPVSAQEGFEVVRRRLFHQVQDPNSVEQVCRAYSNLYRNNASDFPPECREMDYFRKMKMCYPIHPEFFERLYNDWASLESFQRTRGVLRLMATLIYHLWTAGDTSLLIMPGSLLLEIPYLRDELTRYLSDAWNSIIDTEIDGKHSLSRQLDQNNTRFTPRHICRRTARAILLGSAPDVKAQDVRGIDASRIRLGVVQPGENIALFNDALSHLSSSLSYLFRSNTRYWFDTRPNLLRVMKDRMQQIESHLIEEEVMHRLSNGYSRDVFSGVHIWPENSSYIPDDDNARLVVLPMSKAHTSGKANSEAMAFISECIRERGQSPRNFTNMLVFLAPDKDKEYKIKNAAQEYLAWKSICEDTALNLDKQQIKDANQNKNTSDKTLSRIVFDAWSWLISPYQKDTNPIEYEVIEIAGGEIHAVTKAANRAKNNDLVISQWHPSNLKISLESYLWKEKDDCPVAEVWRVLASYCYMPRLKGRNILVEAINRGVQLGIFAWASGIDSNEYQNLKFGEIPNISDLSGLLIKAEFAKAIIEAKQRERERLEGHSLINEPQGEDIGGGTDIQPPKPVIKRQYRASVKLNKLRMGSEAAQISEEIIEYLDSIADMDITVTLSIRATSQNGIPDDIVRVIRENSKVLHFDISEFEE
jgi:predicted AAA+ superfamily ATPase